MAISFFGVSSNPVDNGDLAASTVAVTPPASMQVGDLVVVFLHQRGTATITQNETGGQTWTALANAYTATNTSNTVRMRAFWCEFNDLKTLQTTVLFPLSCVPVFLKRTCKPV